MTVIRRYQRKAERLGVGVLEVEKIEERIINRIDPVTEQQKLVKYHDVVIEGTAPKLSDWEFVGRLEHDEIIGTILRSAPEKSIPAEYQKAEQKCEHCNKDWIRRKDTFIVQYIDGTYKQVGRQCIRDFLGHKDADKVAQWFEVILAAESAAIGEEESDVFSGGMSQPEYFKLDSFLSKVSTIIRLHGWVSRSDAKYDDYKNATADIALNWIFKPSDFKEETEAQNDDDLKLARKAVEWAQGLNGDEISDNEYLYNIHMISLAEITDYWKAGYAASIISSYKRTAEKAAQSAETEYYGKISDKVILEAIEYQWSTSFEGQYGTTTIYKFKKDNYLFTWFSSKEVISVATAVGTKFNLTGTIKDHNEYKGEKQTVLTRCKVEEC